MSKTLPERMADFLLKAFVTANKIAPEPMTFKEGSGTVTVHLAESGYRTVLGRAVQISQGDNMLSLAIEIPRTYYYPYLDHELDACIQANIMKFLSDPNYEFMTDDDAKEFLGEMKAVLDERE